jgi:hypothetical protein
MPRIRPRITTAETKDHRDRLLLLKQKGVAAGDLRTEPDRLTLQQVDREFAWVCELSTSQVAVVALAKLTVLRSGVRIFDDQGMLPWDEPLDLSSPRDHRCLADLMAAFDTNPPLLLNDLWAKRDVPLRLGQYEGVIFAIGDTWAPATYRHGDPVVTRLSLKDEQGNKTDCDFHCRLDRSARHEFERRAGAFKLRHERDGLYGTRIRGGDQPSVSPKPQVATGCDLAGDSRTSKAGGPVSPTKVIDRETIQ